MATTFKRPERPQTTPEQCERRLRALDSVMAAHPLLAGGVVHADGHVFLSVVRYGSPAHLVRVAVVMADGAPHYAWHTGEDHGRIIGPADDPVGAVGVLVRVLVGKAGTCPG